MGVTRASNGPHVVAEHALFERLTTADACASDDRYTDARKSIGAWILRAFCINEMS